jgi:uncharacterized protein (TIGR03067 family)
MRTGSLLLAAFALLPAGFAPAPRPKEKPAPPGGLDGVWVVEKYEYGAAKGERKSLYSKIEIKDGKWMQIRDSNPKNLGALTYFLSLDTSKSPPWLDMRSSEKAKVSRMGVYRLEGDTLIVTYSLSSKPRPEAVDAEIGVSQYRWTMKREKPRP